MNGIAILKGWLRAAGPWNVALVERGTSHSYGRKANVNERDINDYLLVAIALRNVVGVGYHPDIRTR